MNPLGGIFHAPVDGPAHRVADAGAGLVGKPLYDIQSGHEIAIAAVLLLPIVAWWVRIRAADGSTRAQSLLTGYGRLVPLEQLAIWTMAASGAIHLVLAPGHGGGPIPVLFLAQAALLGIVIRRATLGRSWRRLGGLVLVGSVVAYCLALIGGELPDQVGLATKLIEIVGIAALVRVAAGRTAVRSVLGATSVIVLVVATSVAAWVGAFAAAGGTATGHGHGQGHGGGAFPAPGSAMPAEVSSAATPEEAAAAAAVHATAVEALARYADPRVAAADGYDVTNLHGTDFHATNAGYEADGRVLDPERPEDLIYAATDRGPVLLGAMFSVPSGVAGPMIGGPLTVWHAHEHVCIGLLPPGLTGLLSPLGGCPVGSVDVPITNEMIHLWTVPGAPQTWGDLDEAWRNAYLAAYAAGG